MTGSGWGLTVAPLDLALPDTSPPEGVRRRPSRLAEVLPPAGRSRAGKAVELGRVRAMVARLQAYEAALVVGLAADCPDTDDRCPGEPGAASADRTTRPPRILTTAVARASTAPGPDPPSF